MKSRWERYGTYTEKGRWKKIEEQRQQIVKKRLRSEADIGALSIDYEGRKIYLADRPLKVTAKEFDLLAIVLAFYKA